MRKLFQKIKEKSKEKLKNFYKELEEIEKRN